MTRSRFSAAIRQVSVSHHCHFAVHTQIIILAADLLPAGLQLITLQIIGRTIYGDPAILTNAVFIKVILVTFDRLPANRLPALHIIVILPPCFDPAIGPLALYSFGIDNIAIRSHRIFQHAAIAVHIILLINPAVLLQNALGTEIILVLTDGLPSGDGSSANSQLLTVAEKVFLFLVGRS